MREEKKADYEQLERTERRISWIAMKIISKKKIQYQTERATMRRETRKMSKKKWVFSERVGSWEVGVKRRRPPGFSDHGEAAVRIIRGGLLYVCENLEPSEDT